MKKEIFLKEDINALAKMHREHEYKMVVHPMLLDVQLGRLTQDHIATTVAEIDAKYPYVTEDLVIEEKE